MVSFRRSESMKPLDGEWHRFRQEARESAFSINEFSDEEITRYDLETARITGKENPRTYTVNRPIDLLGVNSLDLRELFNR